MAGIKDILNDFSKNIAEEIATKRFYELEEIKAIASARLYWALGELLKEQIKTIDREIMELRIELANSPKSKQHVISLKLSKEKEKRKLYMSAADEYEGLNNFRLLKKYVKEKFGKEVIEDFCKNYPITNITS